MIGRGINTKIQTRVATYIATFVVFFLGYFLLRDSTWQGSAQLHTLMEVIATFLALFVGVMALICFYSRKTNIFLFIGTGFLGTGLLDGYHAVVTSSFFADFFPSPPPSLIPWSWFASRVFLSVLLWLSWLAWRREARMGGPGRISEQMIYLVAGLLTLASLLFFARMPLPRAYYPEVIFHRPEEFLPALFFLLALIGYWRKGSWKEDTFEHWLVLSLIVGFMGQTMFMSFSGRPFDMMFDAAHLLKKLSYIFVLIGLLTSMYYLFRRAEESTREIYTSKTELERANKDLKRREETQELLKELSQDIASLDIDRLLKKLTGKVREFLRVDIADVRLLEGEAWQLRGVSGIDPRRLPESWSRSTSYRKRSIWIRENRRPLMIPDITRGPVESSGKVLESLGVRGFLGVPILSRSSEAIGILRVLTYNPRHFAQEEVDLLQQLANGAAIALENTRLLEETKNQAADLEKSNKVKDEFLGFVSHELRTPLNMITGYTEMIQNKIFGEINEEQKKALEKVMSSSKDLLGMINSLLEATKVEAGAVTVKTDEVALCNFLDELRSAYNIPLDKELTLIWDYPSDLPVMRTDSEKLKHILQNLISNAIKFTEKGSVTISARCLDGLREAVGSGKQAEGNGQVEFKVTDTGIGIPEDSLRIIFEMFRQVEGPGSGSRGGVGLGLHIVKKFADLLGGKIDVESELGKGSTFTVTIPQDLSRPSNHPSLI